MAVNGIPRQLSDMQSKYSFLRTGKVTLVDPFAVSVTVGGTSLRAAYVRQSAPSVGDVVAVTRQGASFFVVGTSSASGDNLVRNPSFEELDDTGEPAEWQFTVATNLSTFEVAQDERAVDGDVCAKVFNPGSANSVSRLYSGAIAVAEGAQLELSCYANGLYPSGDPDTTDVQLQALWFANATDLYPTTSAADTTAATLTDITEDDTMQIMQGTVTVPSGAVFVRVGMRTAADAQTGASYDFVTCRVVG